jgi:hypothetical protein
MTFYGVKFHGVTPFNINDDSYSTPESMREVIKQCIEDGLRAHGCYVTVEKPYETSPLGFMD